MKNKEREGGREGEREGEGGKEVGKEEGSVRAQRLPPTRARNSVHQATCRAKQAIYS